MKKPDYARMTVDELRDCLAGLERQVEDLTEECEDSLVEIDKLQAEVDNLDGEMEDLRRLNEGNQEIAGKAPVFVRECEGTSFGGLLGYDYNALRRALDLS